MTTQPTAQESTARDVAALLLRIGAIQLRPGQPFTWSSGWQSPIYCDNRLALSYPAVRTRVKNALVALVQQHFPAVEAVAGVATAGIPQGALVADALNLPFLYVRDKPKAHGMANVIEGKVVEKQKVVVLEDLISTGGSSLWAVASLRAAGVEVLGLVAIFTYGFEVADRAFAQAGVPYYCLSDYPHLLAEAVRGDYVAEADVASLQAWRKDPSAWHRSP